LQYQLLLTAFLLTLPETSGGISDEQGMEGRVAVAKAKPLIKGEGGEVFIDREHGVVRTRADLEEEVRSGTVSYYANWLKGQTVIGPDGKERPMTKTERIETIRGIKEGKSKEEIEEAVNLKETSAAVSEELGKFVGNLWNGKNTNVGKGDALFAIDSVVSKWNNSADTQNAAAENMNVAIEGLILASDKLIESAESGPIAGGSK